LKNDLNTGKNEGYTIVVNYGRNDKTTISNTFFIKIEALKTPYFLKIGVPAIIVLLIIVIIISLYFIAKKTQFLKRLNWYRRNRR